MNPVFPTRGNWSRDGLYYTTLNNNTVWVKKPNPSRRSGSWQDVMDPLGTYEELQDKDLRPMSSRYPNSGYSECGRYYTGSGSNPCVEYKDPETNTWRTLPERLNELREMEEQEMTETNLDRVSKTLSMASVVSSQEFAKLSPVKQTEVLASASGKPIVFVENFVKLRDKRSLVERLLKGEDVSMELEFNEIELTEEESAALGKVQPVIERIRGKKGDYPWIARSESEEQRCKRMTLGTVRITRDGYSAGVATTEKIWRTASAYWAALANDPNVASPTGVRQSFSGYTKTPVYRPKHVDVGCQTISRYELEYIAEYYGWEPSPPQA